MNAVNEIGLIKTLKFALYTVLLFGYQILLFPPLRGVFLKMLGAKISKNTVIMNVKFFNAHHRGFGGFNLGQNCFIGDETLIDLYEGVSLDDDVTIGQRVTILTHMNVGYKNHPLQSLFPKTSKPAKIKRGSFIGAGTIILPGVIIGEESFVAAGSVVNKDIPAKTLVAGVPAKEVRKLKI